LNWNQNRYLSKVKGFKNQPVQNKGFSKPTLSIL